MVTSLYDVLYLLYHIPLVDTWSTKGLFQEEGRGGGIVLLAPWCDGREAQDLTAL